MKADKVLFTSATKKYMYSLKDIINVERFSTYRKLLGTTAVVLKFGSFHFLSVHPIRKKKSEGHANE